MSSRSRGEWMMLVLPRSSGVTGFEVAGDFLEANIVRLWFAKGMYGVMFSGTQNRQINFTVHFSGKDKQEAYILDGSSQLPEAAAELLSARPPLASPVHRGDQRILIHQVSL